MSAKFKETLQYKMALSTLYHTSINNYLRTSMLSVVGKIFIYFDDSLPYKFIIVDKICKLFLTLKALR